jgi:alkylhydroperoxidase family enzyme
MASSPANAVNVTATLAASPLVGRVVSGSAGRIMFRGSMEPRQREIVILRMGWNCQSEYEFGQHTLFGRDAGLTDGEIYQVTRPIGEGGWSAADATLLQMTDDLYADDCVSDETWTELGKHFDQALAMEFMAAALSYRLVSGLLNSCGVQLDEGVPRWPLPPA